MSEAANRPGRLGVGVIGAGRVGAVLGAALRAAGHGVVGVAAVSEASRERAELLLPEVPILTPQQIVERAELVLLAVPDDQLADLVSGLAATGHWQAGQLVAHTAGRWGVEVLEPARQAGAIGLAIHPSMTFTGLSLDLPRLSGCAFGVTAPAAVLPIAQALVMEMGGEPVVIAEADRPIYHAALAHGANHLTTITGQALQLLGELGLEQPERVLGPLARATLDNALSAGESALTGPVARGDAGTVAEHRQTLAEHALGTGQQDIDRAYRALAALTADRARDRGMLTEAQHAQVLEALSRSRSEGSGSAQDREHHDPAADQRRERVEAVPVLGRVRLMRLRLRGGARRLGLRMLRRAAIGHLLAPHSSIRRASPRSVSLSRSRLASSAVIPGSSASVSAEAVCRVIDDSPNIRRIGPLLTSTYCMRP